MIDATLFQAVLAGTLILVKVTIVLRSTSVSVAKMLGSGSGNSRQI